MAGNHVGTITDLAISEPGGAMDKGDCIGRARRLFQEEFVNAAVARIFALGVVPVRELPPLGGREQRKVRETPGGVRRYCFQQRPPVIEHAQDPGIVETCTVI